MYKLMNRREHRRKSLIKFFYDSAVISVYIVCALIVSIALIIICFLCDISAWFALLFLLLPSMIVGCMRVSDAISNAMSDAIEQGWVGI
jgi:hypothetical protein